MTDPEMGHFYRGFAKMRQLTQKNDFGRTPPPADDDSDDHGDQADDGQADGGQADGGQ